MNLLADESVDEQIVQRLRRDGIDVSYVAEMEPGISDELVLNRSNETNALLLTTDKDFGELVFRDNRTTRGVVLVRLAGLSAEKKAAIVAGAFADHASDFLDCFAVISANRVRIRRRGALEEVQEE
jgi:predicted nuclease of predicted toxin-antitoxin system